MKTKIHAVLSRVPLMVMLVMAMNWLTACTEKNTDPLAFSIPATVAAPCTDGKAEIEITVSGGTKPYLYFVIPETQWNSGDNMAEMLLNNDFSILYRYTYEKNKIPVRAGPVGLPEVYFICVQDAVENGTVGGSNLLSWWKRVQVSCGE